MTSDQNPVEHPAEKVTDAARRLLSQGPRDLPVPGAPAPQAPPVDEPTAPTDPLPPKDDQAGPAPVSPTGGPAGERAQRGAYLTTAQGARLRDTDHSLSAGPRGPVLLQDHHLREKITNFDHERIPERVVHARGAAAHGTFVANGAAENICRAAFLKKGAETETFTRFSTVVGFRGSIDTARDTRGFATKFYTSEGNYDLVGNNFPVFFIQDAIKFPDIIHAAKPHPDREIPQAQSAHDTFWDFVSLHTEAQHHTAWQMSDRAIPRSFRTMEGFGVNTFRMINDADETVLVKLHWKPTMGVHSQVWEEAQLAAGNDPDFHRRDLADAIEAGALPQWDLGVQVFPDTADQMFEGIDLLDPTKIVPEEIAPVQVIGTLTLNANPKNFFAETEQVAFNPGHLVPGIDVTDDPLLQGRLFSYVDTQITRLGGPNFPQLPINRPHADVNDMLRDGMHQSGVHEGVAPYRPNSLDGGCPFHADADPAELGAFVDIPETVPAGRKVREHSASFDDHFSQTTLFYRSLTPVEKDHLAAAYVFELGKCYEENIRTRQLQCLANVDAELCATVAAGLGLPAPAATVEVTDPEPSPALSQLRGPTPVAGRQIGIVADAAAELEDVARLIAAFDDAGTVPLLIAPTGGKLGGELPIQRTYVTAASIEFDALVVASAAGPGGDSVSQDAKAGAPGPAAVDARVAKLLGEVWRHAKAIGGVGDGSRVLEATSIRSSEPGVFVGEAEGVAQQVLDALALHRAWDRFPASAPA